MKSKVFVLFLVFVACVLIRSAVVRESDRVNHGTTRVLPPLKQKSKYVPISSRKKFAAMFNGSLEPHLTPASNPDKNDEGQWMHSRISYTKNKTKIFRR